MNAQEFWQKFYTWGQRSDEVIPGYTIMLTVPGDLPVFTKIALEICSRQRSDHLVETLVIPDQLTAGLPELLEAWAKDYVISPIRLVPLTALDQLLAQKLNHPSLTHWLQLFRAAIVTRTTHAVLHDADLFMIDSNFLKIHYETCVNRRLACLGVSPIWDSWFSDQKIHHVVATWEMMFELDWLRSFEPWQHQAHENVIDGKWHEFDTTLWTQCRTVPERVGRHEQEAGFIHFGHVISSYRWFQQSPRPYEDEQFRLLLIRLLIDAYDPSGWPYDVPSMDELTAGLVDAANRVIYLKDSTRQRYPHFRYQLQQLIQSGLLSEKRTSILKNGIASFDRALGWSGGSDRLDRFPSS